MADHDDLGRLLRALARRGAVKLTVSASHEKPFCISAYDDKHRPFIELGADLPALLAQCCERAGLELDA